MGIILIIAIVVAVVWSKRSYERGYQAGYEAAQQAHVVSKKGVDNESAALNEKESQSDGLLLMSEAAESKASLADNEKEPKEPLVSSAADETSQVVEDVADIIPPPPVSAATKTTLQPEVESRGNPVTVINVALYASSLLIVAGALLLAHNMDIPAVLRCIGVWLMIAVLFGAGLLTYARVPVVRPAAFALVGTALAAVPAGGVAFAAWLDMPAELAWLVSSLIGMAMSLGAAYRIPHEALGYMLVVAVLSFGVSVPASMHAQLVWYYVALMVAAIIARIAWHLSTSIPYQITKPLALVSPWMMPASLGAGLLSFEVLSVFELFCLVSIAALYYVVVSWVEAVSAQRQYNITAARGLSIASLGLLAYLLFGDTSMQAAFTYFIVVIVTLAHVMASVVRLAMRPDQPLHDTVTIRAGLAVALATGLALQATGWNLTSDQVQQLFWALVFSAGALIVAAAVIVLLKLRWLSAGVIAGIATLALLTPGLAGFAIGLFGKEGSYLAGWVQHAILVVIAIVLLLLRSGAPRTSEIWSRKAKIVLYGTLLVWLLYIHYTGAWTSGVYPGTIGLTGLYVAALASFIAWKERRAWLLPIVPVALAWAVYTWCEYLQFEFAVLLTAALWVLVAATLVVTVWLRRPSMQTLASKGLRYLYGAVLTAGILLAMAGYNEVAGSMRMLALSTLIYMAVWSLHHPLLLLAGHAMTIFMLCSVVYEAGLVDVMGYVVVAAISLVLFSLLYYAGSRRWRFLRHPDTAAITLGAAATPALATSLGLLPYGGLYLDARLVATTLVSIGLLQLAYTTRWRVVVRWGVNLLLLYILWDVAMLLSPDDNLRLLITGAGALLLFAGLAYAARARTQSVWWFNTFFWYAVIWPLVVTGVVFDSSLELSAAQRIAAVIMSAAPAAMLLHEAFYRKNPYFADGASAVAIYAAWGLFSGFVQPGVAPTLLAHLCALLMLPSIYLHDRYGARGSYALVRVAIGLAFISIPTFWYALQGHTFIQLLFFIEHGLLVVAGVILNIRLITIWGAVGLTIAAIYVLIQAAYLLYIAIGLAILAGVIYAIRRQKVADTAIIEKKED